MDLNKMNIHDDMEEELCVTHTDQLKEEEASTHTDQNKKEEGTDYFYSDSESEMEILNQNQHQNHPTLTKRKEEQKNKRKYSDSDSEPELTIVHENLKKQDQLTHYIRNLESQLLKMQQNVIENQSQIIKLQYEAMLMCDDSENEVFDIQKNVILCQSKMYKYISQPKNLSVLDSFQTQELTNIQRDLIKFQAKMIIFLEESLK